MENSKGILALVGSQVRVAFLSDYLHSVKTLLSDVTPQTTYMLTNVEQYGIYLSVGTNQNDRNAPAFFVPWIALAAIVPASFSQAQRGAA